MIDRIINTKNLDKADVVILSVPYEHSVSFMGGTSRAPEKIIDCLDNNLELFDTRLKCEPAKMMKTAHIEVKGIQKLIPEKAVQKISSEYGKFLDKKKFTIMLGGEHTVSFGALHAISLKDDPKDITILQIDAHQDLRDDNSDYSEKRDKFAHSCVMRRAHELGYNIVQVGIRTYSKYEYEYWQKNKNTIKVFQWNNSKRSEIDEIIKSIKTKKIYLSIDVDGFDPAHMPGTGTPVQGGLEWGYGMELIVKALKNRKLVGADIVEVSPMRDSVLTEFGAAQLIYTIIASQYEKSLF